MDIIAQYGTVFIILAMIFGLYMTWGIGIVLDLATYGYKVMRTIGTNITELTPSRGFCAVLSAATIVVLASRTGMPVSTTHIAVGSVVGVGLAGGISPSTCGSSWALLCLGSSPCRWPVCFAPSSSSCSKAYLVKAAMAHQGSPSQSCDHLLL